MVRYCQGMEQCVKRGFLEVLACFGLVGSNESGDSEPVGEAVNRAVGFMTLVRLLAMLRRMISTVASSPANAKVQGSGMGSTAIA